MAQQHGRKRTGNGGKASVGAKGSSTGSKKPAGKTGGYTGRTPSSSGQPRQPRQHNSYGKVTHGNSVERGVLTTLLGLGESSSSTSTASAGTGSIFTLTGLFSLLKQNKTARIIAIILVIALVWWLMSGGQCGGYSVSDSLSGLSSGITDSLGIAGAVSTDHSADTSISNNARAKYTATPTKNSTVTIMVYMCGTDLESQYGMATADLQEMIAATIGDNVNLIVETGGTQKWQNSTVSNSTNQIYKVTSKGIQLLTEPGRKSMVEPGTLTEFIGYCTANYTADRYGLIFWDHGGGSVSGYGYDQLYPNGSMTLDEIDTALSNAGCKFDFIGFDACLMATLETALVAERYADYLIASEETEPGVGWYYTDWLTVLSQNPSISTVELGKHIIDDFVETCAKKAPRDKTTLSIIDLAEVSGTVPEAFNEFAASTSELISNNNYQQISNARSATREFASNINQVDLIDLAERIGTTESKAFASALESCVKYNRTSSNITNANGISIFFPYGTTSSMSSALSTYDKIGLDDTYGDCIKEFASVTAGGQIVNGGGASLLGSLLQTTLGGGTTSGSGTGSLLDLVGLLGGTATSGSGSSNSDLMGTMLNLFLSNLGSSKSLTGIDVGQDEEWFNADKVAQYEAYYADNYLDPDRIVITENADGVPVVSLTEKEWDLVQTIELNVFYDDGEGYIDLGMDSIFERDEVTGDLYIDYDGQWVAINDQVVSYYMLSEQWSEDGENYFITGYVPAMLNGAPVQIIVTFDSQLDSGKVAGYRPVYDDVTAPVAKTVNEFAYGDVIEFTCDYYTYDQSFDDNYYFGESIIYDGSLQVSDVELILDSGRILYSYCLTDIYGNQMWTAQTEYNPAV